MMYPKVILVVVLMASPAWGSEEIPLDKTEVTIGQFSRYVEATGKITKAEKTGGMVYEDGWTTKPGWNWQTPYGVQSHPDEPAVHLTYDEAQAYCQWLGKRLPSRDEWIRFGYTEMREKPAAPFQAGTTYPYPTGKSPEGANCLADCGSMTGNPYDKTDYSIHLDRGYGHARAGSTTAGVNGLYDMGANVWEWATIDDDTHQATMGGSWWYGDRQMKADYNATKPRDMAVVYIGFRCISN
ncbi:formylglycine-generating enzyme family protein [Alphaproteobacteria bacterium LSUCC0684]